MVTIRMLTFKMSYCFFLVLQKSDIQYYSRLKCSLLPRWLTFVLSFSDVEPSKRKLPGETQVPPPSQQRPPSPLGPPPALVAQQPGTRTQSSRDISPAVAAALLQLISQQDTEASRLQRREDPSPAADAPAQEQPPTWVEDSPLKPTAEAPASVTKTLGQFPKDQDLRFSHGTTPSPSIPF